MATETIDFLTIERALSKASRDSDPEAIKLVDDWFYDKLERSMQLVSVADQDDYEGF